MSDKLDRLVAYKVMGWPHITFLAEDPADGYIRLGTPYRGADHPTDRCGKWCPSTDIAAAWEVVEHLRKQTKDDGTRKYLVSVVDHDDGKMECVIQPGRLWTMSSCANHEEAPMAICLAALRAVGVPESEIQEAMR